MSTMRVTVDFKELNLTSELTANFSQMSNIARVAVRELDSRIRSSAYSMHCIQNTVITLFIQDMIRVICLSKHIYTVSQKKDTT